MPARKSTAPKLEKNKSLESWIWDAACSIRGAKDAPKYKDFILPLIFTKRLCDVFDDELNRIAAEVGSRKKAFQLAKRDHKLVRFFLALEPADPEQPVWSVIRKFAEGGGQSGGEWSGATWPAIGRPKGERGGAHQFYTPPEVGTIMSKVLQPEPGIGIYLRDQHPDLHALIA